MKTKRNKIVLAVFLLIICFALNAQQTVTDIDGNIYNTVNIGSQKWMKENLKTTHYNNGDSIGTTYPATYNYMSESTPKYQWAYNGKDSLATIYGRLYTWYAATDNRNVCPTGWHLPSYSEFKTLIDYLGGGMVAHGKLKETGTVHWQSPNADATNESGFTGLPGGSHWESIFLDMGICGHYWSASQQTPEWSYRLLLDSESFDETSFLNSAGPKAAWSVRCIEDPIPDSVKYFGQTPPGDSAVIFAKDIISKSNRREAEIVFTTDGKECYFEVESDSGSKIYYTKYENQAWTEQVEASFSINHSTGSPFISADEKRIYFNYFYDNDSKSDIYFAERTTGQWGEPQILPSPINSPSLNVGYTETNDSIIYLSSTRPGGYDNVHGDIWCIHRLSDQSLQANNLGPTINTTMQDANPCVAPDDSYIIFNTNGHSNNWNDLFISFKNENNEWTKPIDMNSGGAKINIYSEAQRAPTISPDGKFLFFNRYYLTPTSNDLQDIYWVSTAIIDTLKTIAFATSVIEIPETENLISVFPNPGNDVFTISLASTPGLNATAGIYDVNGKMVLQQTLNSSSCTIDLTNYPTGMYLVKIDTGTKIFSKKIIKN
jgi:uncharacterized protein (TIGR02145 family)